MRYVGRHRALRPLLLRRPVVGGAAVAAVLAVPVLYLTGNFGDGTRGGRPAQAAVTSVASTPTTLPSTEAPLLPSDITLPTGSLTPSLTPTSVGVTTPPRDTVAPPRQDPPDRTRPGTRPTTRRSTPEPPPRPTRPRPTRTPPRTTAPDPPPPPTTTAPPSTTPSITEDPDDPGGDGDGDDDDAGGAGLPPGTVVVTGSAAASQSVDGTR